MKQLRAWVVMVFVAVGSPVAAEPDADMGQTPPVGAPVEGVAQGNTSLTSSALVQGVQKTGGLAAYARSQGLACADTGVVVDGADVDQRLKIAEANVRCLKEAKAQWIASAKDEGAAFRISAFVTPYVEQAEQEHKVAKSEVDFLSLRWGLGFGYSFGSGDRIDQAAIVNGVVRAESNQRDQPRALLEFHKYFWCNRNREIGTRGCGPFVAVAATDDEVLSGVAMGFMFGMKAKKDDPDGFSIGVGAILDDDVKDLAGGFKDGEEPPAGETTVRFETEARWSAIVFVTRTF